MPALPRRVETEQPVSDDEADNRFRTRVRVRHAIEYAKEINLEPAVLVAIFCEEMERAGADASRLRELFSLVQASSRGEA